jgi:hypothetical protein
VRVAAADEAELVRVHAQLHLEYEAVLERRAGVLELEHLLLLRNAAVEVPLVPELEVGELVVRGEVGMRLAGPLGLGHLVEPLPLRARFRVFPVDLLAERLDRGEHKAVAQVPVVGDGEHLAAGLFFRGRHPFPQILGVVASERLQRGIRLHPPGLVPVFAEYNVAVQVVPPGIGGPLEPDEGREPARIVIGLRGLDCLLPGRPVRLRARQREPLGEFACAEAPDDVDRRLGALTALDLVVPPPALLCGQKIRVAAHQQREEAHPVRVVRHDEEVERPGELDRLAGVGRDLLAPCEPVGIAGGEPRPERPRVHGEPRVKMRVAEERACGEVAARVRRVRRPGGVDFFKFRLVDRTEARVADSFPGCVLRCGEGRRCQNKSHQGSDDCASYPVPCHSNPPWARSRGSRWCPEQL